MKTKIKVRLSDGTIIERVPARVLQRGNFAYNVIRYQRKEYLVGNGDEYLHDMPDVFEIGSVIE